MHLRSGFTLLELAIVLVIIGLLLGGTIAGREMIEQAREKKAVTELTNYKLAFDTFRLKYNALPGDMKNATSMWGRADGGTPVTANCANPTTNEGTGTQTCNGNGDKAYQSYVPATHYENFRFWQHLTNAKMLSFNTTGHSGSANYAQTLIGTNIPATDAFVGGGYSVQTITPAEYATTHNPWLFYPVVGTTFILGSQDPDLTDNCYPVMSARAASNIDAKIDDGRPGTGKVSAYKNSASWSNECVTTDNPITAQYNSVDDIIRCSLYFRFY